VHIETLVSAARAARHLPDRLLHPWRRRSALRRLAQFPRPGTVLFVCHGSICRSPYAAAVARRLLTAGVAVESAGFIGPDRPSPPEAIGVAGERGLDLSPHRSQLITADHLRNSDVVIVMDSQQRSRLVSLQRALAARVVLLGDLDPEPITRRTVLDPVEQTAEVFRSCYDRIDRCVGALAALWRAPRGDDAQGQGGKLE
jgi:protein-tyrosine phosphatase